jgi:phosphatidylinositol glycan class W
LLIPRTTSTSSPTQRAKPPPASKDKDERDAYVNPLPKKAFLTTYRGAMIVITCIAILAVDFRIFPRRFAKVETWGTSLMDVGVGSFVFSAGLVGARPLLKSKLSGEKLEPLGRRLVKSGRHALPLIVLGFVRLWSVKGLDYAEHVSEYGVHWNFFFTMGFVPPFVAVFQSFFQFIPSYEVLAVLLGAGYKVVLNYTALTRFILLSGRGNLLEKNREGIFSFFGYLAIFLAGQGLGMVVLPRGGGSTSSSSKDGKGKTKAKNGWEARKTLLLKLVAWSVGWSSLFMGSIHWRYGLNLDVSRRLANLPYILWIAAFNTTQITAFCLVETVFFPAVYRRETTTTSSTSSKTTKEREEEAYRDATSPVLEAYNRNGLFIFLIANLLTGLVNLTVPTLDVSDAQAMGVLVGYAAVVTGVAVGLDLWDISIKL